MERPRAAGDAARGARGSEGARRGAEAVRGTGMALTAGSGVHARRDGSAPGVGTEPTAGGWERVRAPLGAAGSGAPEWSRPRAAGRAGVGSGRR